MLRAAIEQTGRYIRYFFKSKTRFSVHSPFVFELLTRVIQKSEPKETFKELFNLKSNLLQRKDKITITDFGAGSHINNGTEKSISTIAKNAAKPYHVARILFALAQHFQPRTLLEFGTSLGISSAYMALGHRAEKHVTLEGCPETAKVAKENLNALEFDHVKIEVGPFEKTLPSALSQLGHLDFVFFDGNHQYQPTLDYFEACLAKKHEDSIFIFDDIHWSTEMERAWEDIKKHPETTITIDLFWIGLVFFKKDQAPEHFILR
jgi:predicted O-methyltransferase YrrM